MRSGTDKQDEQQPATSASRKHAEKVQGSNRRAERSLMPIKGLESMPAAPATVALHGSGASDSDNE
jgi:hypothetical protein